MFNHRRAATVLATRDTLCWTMSRQAYQRIKMAATDGKRKAVEAFLSELPAGSWGLSNHNFCRQLDFMMMMMMTMMTMTTTMMTVKIMTSMMSMTSMTSMTKRYRRKVSV